MDGARGRAAAESLAADLFAAAEAALRARVRSPEPALVAGLDRVIGAIDGALDAAAAVERLLARPGLAGSLGCPRPYSGRPVARVSGSGDTEEGAAVGTAVQEDGTQAVVDAAQNKLAAAIVHGELALGMADGPVRERVESLLAAAWAASALLRGLSPARAPPRVGD